ncbi:NAAT family transporter [bacterium]|nr:MAG: NAAT family transporter [bacterium]
MATGNLSVWQFFVTAFVALLLVVDPLGLAPLFVGLTEGQTAPQRRAILRRAITVSLGVSLFFLLAGQKVLGYMGISIHAFGISGGILLFATALPMIFGGRSPSQRPEDDEEGSPGEDIAIFPLAIPLLAGPGTVTTILLLASRSGFGDQTHRMLHSGALVLAIVAAFITSFWVLFWGEKLMRQIGQGGIHILTRVMGILLGGLAVQFVLNGLSGYWFTLTGK